MSYVMEFYNRVFLHFRDRTLSRLGICIQKRLVTISNYFNEIIRKEKNHLKYFRRKLIIVLMLLICTKIIKNKSLVQDICKKLNTFSMTIQSDGCRNNIYFTNTNLHYSGHKTIMYFVSRLHMPISFCKVREMAMKSKYHPTIQLLIKKASFHILIFNMH